MLAERGRIDAANLVPRPCFLLLPLFLTTIIISWIMPLAGIGLGGPTSAREALRLAEAELKSAEGEARDLEKQLEAARQSVDRAEGQIRTLRRKLPDEDQALISRSESQIEALRVKVIEFRTEREDAENQIGGLLEQMRQAVEERRQEIQTRFFAYAGPFFAEDVRLVYAPRLDRIGQIGRRFEFPAFEVEMTSAGTDGAFARRTDEQVSLSQRNYLDLSFKMAVMGALSTSGGTLIVDGPEGSVDAVFADRAGELFARFTNAPDRENRLIAACNVIEGGFLPHLFKDFPKATDRRRRTINLFEIAVPTAAVRELRSEYTAAILRVYARMP